VKRPIIKKGGGGFLEKEKEEKTTRGLSWTGEVGGLCRNERIGYRDLSERGGEIS